MCENNSINNNCEEANHDCSKCGSGDGHGGCAHSHDSNTTPNIEDFMEMTYKQNMIVVSRLEKVVESLNKSGKEEAALYVLKCMNDFEKGNMMLNLALSMIKENN